MREIIVGTAGHIDHGKTALVEALTGVNTDRLKEEQIRGITIELGFADFTLPSGRPVAVVDVPGHERFVKTMVAGATGIDLVILVVAADEGVMPQTREHLDICRLLRVRKGLVALTKVDLPDEEWIQLVEEDVREFVRGTFLEGAPVVRTSKVTGEGFGELASQLDRLCGELGERPAARHFRLPIDRVFTMKGFGTVVTGTLVEGRLAEGEAVEVAPGGVRSKVRGLQVHNRAVRESLAGMRTAVNLQGVEKEEVARGDVLVPPEAFLPTHMVDVHLEYLPTAPWKLKQRARVRFHTGTSEILGRVVLLDRQLLEPGDAAYAQLRLESPTLVVHGDPFVIRSYSPTLTIGGGLVLDGLPPKHRRNAPRVLAHLREIHLGDPARVALAMVRAAGIQGLTRKDLDRRLNLPQDRWREIQAAPGFRDEVQGIDGSAGTRPREEDALYMAREIYERLQGEILEALRGFGREHPLESGIPREDLRGRCPSRPSARAFTAALQDLLDRREVSVDGDRWRWKGHRLALEGAHQARLEELAGVFREAGLQPPLLKEAGGALGVSDKEARDLAEHLARRGELVKVKEDLYFHQAAVQGLQDRLVSFLKERGEIQPLEFKEMTQLSRKYMIPLLEHFDRIKVTMRVGDKRVLRG